MSLLVTVADVDVSLSVETVVVSVETPVKP